MFFFVAQELLRMFGCPYIESPAEAEAQCAKLEEMGLVDGIITEDSDTFLFGAKTVYKHVFDQNHYPERYTSDAIREGTGLNQYVLFVLSLVVLLSLLMVSFSFSAASTRERLIALALLLGSDYTVGIRGIGIVNAMEVISVYPTIDSLRDFTNWVYSGSKEKKPTNPARDPETWVCFLCVLSFAWSLC
jgi:DNA excision repair protein ERCC-5